MVEQNCECTCTWNGCDQCDEHCCECSEPVHVVISLAVVLIELLSKGCGNEVCNAAVHLCSFKPFTTVCIVSFKNVAFSTGNGNRERLTHHHGN